MRVAAVGEVGIDLYVEKNARFLGGCSANFARAAATAGASAALFAAIGDDDRGREVAGLLATTPLELHVRSERGATALQRIRVDPTGERIFDGWEPGVVASYRLAEAELAALAAMDVIALADTPAWQQCLGLGPRVVADFSRDAPTAWRFDGLAIAFVGGTVDDLDRLRGYDTLIVLTAGAAGAWAIDRGRVIHQPTLATRVVDTTGCGDAFQAAFTVAYCGGEELADSLAAGARAAAAVAARLGA